MENTQAPSELDRVRYPTLIFTEDYLNDPIKFSVDPRFQPRTITPQTLQNLKLVGRDNADYATVDTNELAGQIYSFRSYSYQYNREKYYSVFTEERRTFNELQ